MRFLRTAPTRRLLATIGGVLIAAISCSAIAVAATSGGPVPAPKSLAAALHDGLAAQAPAGISADITFTNNLIGSSQIVSSDPLLTGASGRLWMTGDHFRLELQSANGDAQIVASKSSFWVYDPSSQTVYEGSLPATTSTNTSPDSGTGAVPTLARIQTVIDKLAAHLTGLDAIPTDVAGAPAYSVRVSPKDTSGLLGSVQLAWDATHGVPLSFAIYAKGDPNPVISLQATAISFGPVDGSVFAITPPSGTKVVDLGSLSSQASDSGSASNPTAPMAAGSRSPLTFAVDAPASAGGLQLTSQDRAGRDGQLLSYGTGLGSVKVLERPAKGTASALPGAASAGGQGQSQGLPLSLPTETINGATVTELSTELGTVLEFTRTDTGISYLVFGSVPLATANAVAHDL
jgi:outer membrane lipoprotein-sorting protein